MFDLDSKQHRTTRIHNRGNFLDQGAEVKASVLTGFAEFPSSAPSNRLGVAHWLMQPDNPLTARVAVNRIWARLFGTGLVETEEDFGTQGMPPPSDVAGLVICNFREQGWSFKQLLKASMSHLSSFGCHRAIITAGSKEPPAFTRTTLPTETPKWCETRR